MNLADLAKIIKSDFTSLQPSGAIGRIMLVSGRCYSRSFNGLQMMKQQGLTEGWLDETSYDAVSELIKRQPHLVELFDRLDLIPPGKVIRDKEPEKHQANEYCAPIPTDLATIIKRLNLPALDDDFEK